MKVFMGTMLLFYWFEVTTKHVKEAKAAVEIPSCELVGGLKLIKPKTLLEVDLTMDG